MALETRLRRFAWIDDGVGRAAGFNVQAAGTVTGFAADVPGVVAWSLQMIMDRGVETAINVLMTLLARLGAGIGRAGDLRRRYFHPVQIGAGNYSHSHQRCPKR